MLAPETTSRQPGVFEELKRQPGFLACVALLLVFLATYKTWAWVSKVQFVKEAVPLRKPLDQLEQHKLFPYRLLESRPLKPEMEETLGTKQYISWMLEDTSASPGAPDRFLSLFVTYYTGNPNQVPHVPEVCYLGSGFEVQDATYLDVPVPSLGGGFKVPMQVLEFQRSKLFENRESRIVMYTFQVNGQFAPGRREAIAVLSNPLDKYAYFSKLEITFGTQDIMPSKDVALRAGERLLQVVVPVLLKEHWPDWEAVTTGRAGTSQPAAASTQPVTRP